MSTGWFGSLGWWDQKAAYAAFDFYRDELGQFALDDAIKAALPIIRVVYSTQKFKITYAGDEDDLISHAAFTIAKAIPKMSEKPKEKLDNDKKYMRYLFTCVVNAFYREYDILHGKHNKLQRRLIEHNPTLTSNPSEKTHKSLEAEMTLKRLPQQLFVLGMECVRFEGQSRRVCAYILTQMITGREIAKSVLQLMGCKDRHFFVQYCSSILFRAFLLLRRRKPHVDETNLSNEFFTDTDVSFYTEDNFSGEAA